MNEYLLKMNGLSVDILQKLSYESRLGIPLKKNLHYFDKDALLAELNQMTDWLDSQNALADIALDYRIKSKDSIILNTTDTIQITKYGRYLMIFLGSEPFVIHMMIF